MNKKLYRSNHDRMVAGVCGGLAEYFNIDPVIVRLLFVLSIFLGGFGILAYIILAIVLPQESSVVTEPAATIKENIHEFKDTAAQMGQEIRSTFHKDTTGQTQGPVAAVAVDDKETYCCRRHRGGFIVGAILIVVGIIALASTVGPLHWAWWFSWGYLWPLLLVGFGLLILLTGARRRR